jgi:hypothetical protein
MVNQWPGVVTVGVFAHQRADVCLLATPQGVNTMTFPAAGRRGADAQAAGATCQALRT